ncbi:MAG: hypothetical protein IKL63_02745 [Alistipes sp.]|nr:hypothetical protein [Alistipes sp.]
MSLKQIFIALLAVAAVACADDDEQLPQVDADKVATQLKRKPFYDRNPESSAPTYTVSSAKHRLEFAGWGADDPTFTLDFPEEGDYRRVVLCYTMCSEGEGPADYDNTVMLYVRNKADGVWYEIARAMTPFGDEFDQSWSKSFYIDVTEYREMLKGSTEFKYYYSGFDATERRAHAFSVSFNGYVGDEEQEVLGAECVYDSSINPNTGYRSWAYGVAGHDIESEERLGQRTLTLPAGTGEVLLRVAITGHGHDMGDFPDIEGYVPENAAEFVFNKYFMTVNDVMQAAYAPIFYSNANNYYQSGTYMYDRANWAPGNPINTHYWSLNVGAAKGATMSIDIDLQPFVSTFDQPNAEGVANYIVTVYAFYLK